MTPSLYQAEKKIAKLTEHRDMLIAQLEILRDALQDGYRRSPEGRIKLVEIQNALDGRKS